jgi:hypothetical protein
MIYAIPIGDRNTASSRLRVFQIQPFIKDYIIGYPEEYKKGDILIIQKVSALEELEKAKREGAKVIYDIDDYYWDRPEYLKMVQKADLVTCDTEKKAHLLKYDNDNVKVIPDSLDWDGTYKEKYEHKNIIGWTGYGNNTHYLNDIEIPKPFTLRLITTPDWPQYYKDNQAQSRPWSLDKVDKYLAECDLGIYYLPTKKFEEVKGMHKLLKNWAIGLPTYTSPMPDYVKAMDEAGVGHKYLIHHWDTLKDVPFDERCQDYAFKYKPEVIAQVWKSTIEELTS